MALKASLARRIWIRPALRYFSLSSSTLRAADHARIVEVGPRDGLQNEKSIISPETKIDLIQRLAQTGLTHIEAGSFVSPKWVPQMASTSEIFQRITSAPSKAPHSIAYNFLVPNVRGMNDLVALLDSESKISDPPPTSLDTHSPASSIEISIFLAATETFSLKNTNSTISQSLQRCLPILQLAKTRRLRTRGYISVALGCPYEGPDVNPHKVAEMTASLLQMGCDDVSVADTTGMGTAPRTRKLLSTLKEAGVRAEDIALHFHDTYGQALVNTVVGLENGIRTFDSAVGGLGGCPFSPGATGNVATEDLVHLLHSLGVQTGVDLEAVAEVGGWITGELGKANDSRAGKAILARKHV